MGSRLCYPAISIHGVEAWKFDSSTENRVVGIMFTGKTREGKEDFVYIGVNFLGFSDYKPEEITVIRDTQTDLDWEVKSLEPNDKRFFKNLMTWNEFKSYIDYLNEISYGGFSDWRVPSKHELRSLINYADIAPAYNKEIFKTVTPDDYWCGAEPFPPRPDCGWVINFNIDSTTAKNQSLQSQGLAVRGKKTPAASRKIQR